MYSPTVADDMLLMSFSKAGMDGLLDICWKYSITWRFFYNPEKCKIVVFNEKTSPLQNRIFTLGPTSSAKQTTTVISESCATNTFHPRTVYMLNVNFSFACLNITPVEVIINYKKLQMFGQICRLKDGYIAKEIFNHRIGRYVNGDSQTFGFVPAIYRLLQKYGMIEMFDTHWQCGAFPSKCSWKQTLKSTVIMPSVCHVSRISC